MFHRVCACTQRVLLTLSRVRHVVEFAALLSFYPVNAGEGKWRIRCEQEVVRIWFNSVSAKRQHRHVWTVFPAGQYDTLHIVMIDIVKLKSVWEWRGKGRWIPTVCMWIVSCTLLPLVPSGLQICCAHHLKILHEVTLMSLVARPSWCRKSKV
jgi:hypothetical protein